MEYHNKLSLKERFKALCEKKGVKPFSKVFRKSTIDSIINDSIPAADAVLEVAKALNVTVEELLTGEETHPIVAEETAEYSALTAEERKYVRLLLKVLRSGRKGFKGGVTGYLNDFEELEAEEEEAKANRS